jgi:hypothetical protein
MDDRFALVSMGSPVFSAVAGRTGRRISMSIFVQHFQRDGCRQTKTWQQRGTLWNYQRIETI